MDPHKSTGNDAIGLQQDNANGEKRGLLQTRNHNPDDKTRPNRHHDGATVDPIIKVESSVRTGSDPDPGTDAEMEEFVREMVHDFGPDRFAVFVYLGLIVISIISIAGFFLLSWSWIVAIVNVLATFVIVSSPVFRLKQINTY